MDRGFFEVIGWVKIPKNQTEPVEGRIFGRSKPESEKQ